MSTNPNTILSSVFGYAQFRAGQEEVIKQLLAGRDCLTIMPTGSGKSLCYQIPALALPGYAIVISPLIALMQDQVEQLDALGVSAAYLNSTLNFAQQEDILTQLNHGELKILYIAPEKLLQSHFLDKISNFPPSLIAIDEAHCVSQWGHDFRPDYAQLGILKQQFPRSPIIALTATADAATQNDIIQLLGLSEAYHYVGSFDRPNIRYIQQEKFRPLSQLEQYIKQKKNQSGIVYCTSRKRVEEVNEYLQRHNFRSAAYHAGLTLDERNWAQGAWLKDDLEIIVATVAFGMGINKPDVRYVIHYDIPRSIENYYQETGRAGRDGLDSEAILLYEYADADRVRWMINQNENIQRAEVESHKFASMTALAESETCRRLVLLNYFGEQKDKACNNCDICLDPPKKYDGLLDAQKALSAIYRIGQSSGFNHVIDVLRGANTQRVREYKHNELSVYGIGKSHSQEYWLSILRQLVHLGLIRIDITDNAHLKLTEAARPVLRSETSLQLALPQINKSAEITKETKPHLKQEYDKRLFERLRKVRKRLADETDVPPYIIFNDATLVDMCLLQPDTNQQMLLVSGVGKRKLEKYGQAFLTEIINYINRFD
ncbi:DNA helicase RecQ [Catenovulum sediminis]|uniref:DNA helicase RecQ n=1 Tax=Catenovulum sediminis TaxID=1740262 RepID=A0ABV1RND9_9ALTE